MKLDNEIPRLSRLSAILTLLLSKRIITATEIAERFLISKRTAYRDIKALEESGVPIFTEEGKGYSIIEGYSLPPIMFTEKEANALITAQQLISRNLDKSLVDNHFSAILKIKSVLRNNKKKSVEILSSRVASFKNYNVKHTSNNLSGIQIAITNQNLIEIDYHSIQKNENTKRTIEPQALYHSQENWILIAWCKLRKDYREFRLDRIKSIDIKNEKYEDRNFSFKEYYKNYTS